MALITVTLIVLAALVWTTMFGNLKHANRLRWVLLPLLVASVIATTRGVEDSPVPEPVFESVCDRGSEPDQERGASGNDQHLDWGHDPIVTGGD